MTLEVGWNSASSALRRPCSGRLRPGARPRGAKGRFVVHTARGEMPARPSGRMRYDAGARGVPVVGDWVAVRICGRRPRR